MTSMQRILAAAALAATAMTGSADAVTLESELVVAPGPERTVLAGIDVTPGTNDLSAATLTFLLADGSPAKLATDVFGINRFSALLADFGNDAGPNYVTDVELSLLGDGGVVFTETLSDFTVASSLTSASVDLPAIDGFSSARVSFSPGLDGVGTNGSSGAPRVFFNFTGVAVSEPDASAVPLPPTALMLLGGFAGLAALRRRR